MTILSARKWIIASSFVISTGVFVFFSIAPALDYPLLYDQSWRLLQIVFPVFVGYLASGAHFVFSTRQNDGTSASSFGKHGELAGMLIRWPVLIFGLLVTVLIAGFGYSNRRNASAGTGMNVDQLATGLSLALGLLSATTNLAVSYLFAIGEKDK